MSDSSSKEKEASGNDEAILPGTPFPRQESMDAADADGDDYDRAPATEADADGDKDGAETDDGGETPAKKTKKARQRRASVQQWAATRQHYSTRDSATEGDGSDPVADAARARARSMSRSTDGRNSAGIRPPPDAKITGHNQVAWECFKAIDTDASGLLDDAEVDRMCKEMKIPGISPAKLKKQLKQMGTADPDGQVSFREFAIWWNRHREVERRRARRDIKELFDLVDDDGSGLLDKEELAQFVRKAQKFKPMQDVINGDIPFDLEKDWKLMRRGAPGGLDGVSFPMFESWWKDRAGVSDQVSSANIVGARFILPLHSLRCVIVASFFVFAGYRRAARVHLSTSEYACSPHSHRSLQPDGQDSE